ncbi:MAG TPA: Ig-like domain-containing protein [Longimicrobium sp.]|nr:Ig-like domain-containing protein [Longimicrobium sp.]
MSATRALRLSALLLALSTWLAPAAAAQQAEAITLPTTPLRGDVDGDGRVTTRDARAVTAHAAGAALLPEGRLLLADADGDGRVGARDALLIESFARGRDVAAYGIGRPVPGEDLVNGLIVFDKAPNGARLSIAGGDGQTGVAGQPLGELVSVAVRDGAGNPITGMTVTWSATGGGRVSKSRTGTGAGGVSATSWTLSGAGSQTLRATVAGAGSVDFKATAVGGGGLSIQIVSGDGLYAIAGDTVGAPQQVKVTTPGGGSPGVKVTWTAKNGGSAVSAQTSPVGGVHTNRWILGALAGAQQLVAKIPGGDSVVFNVTAVAAAQVQFSIVSGDNQTGTSGDSLPQELVVKADDGAGHGISTTVRWSVLTGGGSLRAANVVTDGTGTAANRWLLGPQVGYQTAEAHINGVTPVLTFTALAALGNDGSLERLAGDTVGVAGEEIGVPPSVRVRDGNGNPVPGYPVTFTVLAGGGEVSNGVVTSTTTVTVVSDLSGVATLDSWKLGTVPGTNTVRAQAGAVFLDFHARGTAGPPANMVIHAGDGQTATVGTAVAVAPSVLVTDANGNPVPGASVTFTPTSGGGSVTGSPATTDANGIAAVGSWTLGTTAGGNTLTASTAGVADVVFTATATPGAVDHFTVEAQGGGPIGSQTAGAPFGIRVTAQDQYGNTATSFTGTVEITSTGNLSAGGGTTASFSGGVLAAHSVTISNTGSFTITATRTGGSETGTSNAFSVGAGAAANMVINAGDGQTATVGTAVAIAPSVLVTDANGNPVPGHSVTFTATTGGGSVTGSPAATDANGIATVGSWTLGTTAGGNTLTASASGVVSVVFSATATPGAVDHFTVEAQGGGPIGTQTEGTPFGIQVTALDAYNNVATGFTGTVDVTSNLALASGGGTTAAFSAGVLASHTVNYAASGTATITVTRTGGSETGASNAFTVLPLDAAPSVTATAPANGDTAVPTGTAISITFSEPVNATPASFSLTCGAAQPFTLGGGGASWTLTPNAPLPSLTTCTVTVFAAGVTDVDALDPPDNMLSDYVFSFTTDLTLDANDETYPETVLGNVSVSSANAAPAFSVTDNDAVDGSTSITFAGWSGTPGATEKGGNVTITSSGPNMGQFTYDPPAGYEGTDRFTYTLTRGASTATATVTLTVSGMVWFIDNNAPACTSTAAGCGRLSNPFSTLAAFSAANTGFGSSPAAGEPVFLYESATPYTAPVTLQAGQKLIGQDATAALATLAGLSPAPSSAPLPATDAGNAVKVTITGTDGVNLASNNALYGMTLATTAGQALGGSGFGTLTLANGTSQAADVAIASAGQAIFLNTGTASGAFASVSSTGGANNVSLNTLHGALDLGGGSLAGATGSAFHVHAGTAALSYAGSIAGTTNRPVEVINRTGGSVTLSGAITGTGPGIIVSNNSGGSVSFTGTQTLTTAGLEAVSLQNNTGASISFTGGALAITTTGLPGFHASGGGTVTVTGAANTVANTGGTAVIISNTGIGAAGVTFRSVSAAGAPNGIVLDNTGSAGGFTVTGDGATPGSGGTIANAAGADGATAGNGVYLNGAHGVSLSWMNLSGHANNGLYGTGVRGLALDRVRFTGTHGNTSSGTFNESAVHLVDVGGAVRFTRSVFNGGAMNAVRIANTAGTAPTVDSLVFEADTVTHMQGSLVDVRGSAILVNVADGSADTRIRNSRVTYWWGNAIHVLVQGTASGTTRITNNFVDNTNAAVAGAGGIWVTGGSHAYAITGNTVRHTHGAAISADRVAAGAAMSGTIDGNLVGVSGDPNSGSHTGIGILATHHGAGTTTVRISNNVLRQINGSASGAITTLTGDAAAFGGSGTMNATVVGNNIQESGTTVFAAQHGILVTHGTTVGDADQGCYDIGGSTPALRNTIANFNTASGPTAQNRIRVNARFNTTSRFPGYTGAQLGATSASNLATYLLGRNTASNSLNANSSTGGFHDTVPAGSACPQPPAL